MSFVIQECTISIRKMVYKTQLYLNLNNSLSFLLCTQSRSTKGTIYKLNRKKKVGISISEFTDYLKVKIRPTIAKASETVFALKKIHASVTNEKVSTI